MLEFRETELFTRAVTALLSDAEYAELQGALIVDPEAGGVIKEQAVFESYGGVKSAAVKASVVEYE